MAKRTTSRWKVTALCTLGLAVVITCAFTCEFDTQPRILPHPPVAGAGGKHG